MIHDWWAVELRSWTRAGDAKLTAAIEHVLEVFEHPKDQDCSDCFERWMDETSGGREVDDFPEVLAEEHVGRIMALEDAVLVRHALGQWLMALGARRARAAEEELAARNVAGQIAADLVAVPRDPEERPSARMRARSPRRH